eukprot:jgi/Chlat1/1100/Chrsp110S00058
MVCVEPFAGHHASDAGMETSFDMGRSGSGSGRSGEARSGVSVAAAAAIRDFHRRGRPRGQQHAGPARRRRRIEQLQEEDEEQEEGVDIGQFKVYMACIFQSKSVGMACYDVDTGALQVTESWQDNVQDDSLESLQLSELQFVRVRGMQDGLSEQEWLHQLNSMLNLSQVQQVRAAGALLSILQKEGIITTAMDADSAESISVESISEVSLKDFLTVDATSRAALQIFHKDRHPSAMGIGTAKEGQWFLRPVADIDLIEDRLDTVAFLMKAPDLVEALKDCLHHVRDVPRILNRFRSASSRSIARDWAQLLEVARDINDDLVQVHDLINDVIDFEQAAGEGEDTVIAYGLCEELDELKHLYAGLPDFLGQVAQLEMERLPSKLRHHYQKQGTIIAYIPQVGYTMRFEGERLSNEVLGMLPDFQFAFEGNDDEGHGAFYYTSRTRELDDEFGDIYHKILDMESTILRDLESRILERSDSLQNAAMLAAELDCLVSFAVAAKEYHYARPQLVKDNVCRIKGGRCLNCDIDVMVNERCILRKTLRRHMLQEMVVDTFVPNHTDLSAEGRIQVITGPNCSGKSVYAKQVALIVFLAHIGSFVPADECVIGLTDRIFTRIASQESAVVPQSTFMVDLHQVASMLRHATSRSLCIIDEFGKGTLASNGVGLVCGMLKHLAEREPLPPKVLLCTHFSEVLDPKYLPVTPQLSFRTMSVAEQEEEHSSNTSVTNTVPSIAFLFKLVPGYVAPSFGIHCARLARLPEDVLKRAAHVLQLEMKGKPVDRLCNADTRLRDELYKRLVRKLKSFDCRNGDVQAFLTDVLEASPSPARTASTKSHASRSTRSQSKSET